ncbi:hypothetical protein, partial [Herbaspirillum sp. B65]|uniref:hypothetical protein n=1 Tax=Herbaspirillum sp. B65 TaxID=137708 RepID=UPI001C2747DC
GGSGLKRHDTTLRNVFGVETAQAVRMCRLPNTSPHPVVFIPLRTTRHPDWRKKFANLDQALRRPLGSHGQYLGRETVTWTLTAE